MGEIQDKGARFPQTPWKPRYVFHRTEKENVPIIRVEHGFKVPNKMSDTNSRGHRSQKRTDLWPGIYCSKGFALASLYGKDVLMCAVVVTEVKHFECPCPCMRYDELDSKGYDRM
jgi:hypothetical protein